MDNNTLAIKVLEELIRHGVEEFCISPGSRNSPLVMALLQDSQFCKYYWFEERSAAFFALGRARATQKPVAVITTSGTAAGELLAATMEAYYTGVPLILVTADRPRRFRGTGAPQTAEQLNLFGVYTRFSQDLEAQDACSLDSWAKEGPAHINVCFEEPKRQMVKTAIHAQILPLSDPIKRNYSTLQDASDEMDHFFQQIKKPLVIVSTLNSDAKEEVIQFLLKLNAPVYAEGVSGLREDGRLSHLQIQCVDKIWQFSKNANYSIDGILRIGGVPTVRLWRDLEEMQNEIKICSINHVPFSGLSWAGVICLPLKSFFSEYRCSRSFDRFSIDMWLSIESDFLAERDLLFKKFPHAEPSLVHRFSKLIPDHSLVYLGNSLPIREWDFAAVREDKQLKMYASRGVNGIDGQISTFLGLCLPKIENWTLIGDLTALYDMAGPWILSQLNEIQVNIAIINNGGGKIFSRMYPDPRFCHPHQLHFKPLAEMWSLAYEKWQTIPDKIPPCHKNRMIEIVPDEAETVKFWAEEAKKFVHP